MPKVWILTADLDCEATAEIGEPLPDFIWGPTDADTPTTRYYRGTAEMIRESGASEVVPVYIALADG